MTSSTTWFNTPVQWLDERGKGAWITAMILGFIFVWPLGLAILFFMLWSNRMNHSFFKGNSSFGCKSTRRSNRTTGNAAFDAYKEDTIQRLNDEQHEFQSFLQRLREAKDKTEFDEFMDARSKEQKEAS